MRCTSGHDVPAGSKFCPECGDAIVTDSAAPRPAQSATLAAAQAAKKPDRVLLITAIGSVVAIAALALFVVLRTAGGDARTLTVSLTTVWGEPQVGCYLEDNALTAQHMRGTRFLVSDADGSVVGAGTLDPNGQRESIQLRNRTGPTEQCLWSVTIDEVPPSDAYTIDIETPQDGNESFTSTRSELDDLEWKVVLTRG